MSMLQSRDRKKRNSRIVQRSKAGKTRRSQSKTAKQNDAHKTQLDAYKKGTFYKSGVAMAHAKKTLKEIPRNPSDVKLSNKKTGGRIYKSLGIRLGNYQITLRKGGCKDNLTQRYEFGIS